MGEAGWLLTHTKGPRPAVPGMTRPHVGQSGGHRHIVASSKRWFKTELEPFKTN